MLAEERLPDPRARGEAAAGTWADARSGDGTGRDAGTDSTGLSQPDTGTEPPARDEDGEDGPPDPYERQVAVPAMDGTDVPVTVEYLSPEARTVGDTTPTGIGRKPTSGCRGSAHRAPPGYLRAIAAVCPIWPVTGPPSVETYRRPRHRRWTIAAMARQAIKASSAKSTTLNSRRDRLPPVTMAGKTAIANAHCTLAAHHCRLSTR